MEMEFKSTGGANSEHERQTRVGGGSGGYGLSSRLKKY